jgi:hypothetical protein
LGDKFLGIDGKPITALYLDDKLLYNEEGYRVWGKNFSEQVNKISKSIENENIWSGNFGRVFFSRTFYWGRIRKVF